MGQGNSRQTLDHLPTCLEGTQARKMERKMKTLHLMESQNFMLHPSWPQYIILMMKLQRKNNKSTKLSQLVKLSVPPCSRKSESSTQMPLLKYLNQEIFTVSKITNETGKEQSMRNLTLFAWLCQGRS